MHCKTLPKNYFVTFSYKRKMQRLLGEIDDDDDDELDKDSSDECSDEDF